MDISSAAVGLKRAESVANVQIAVAKKIFDQQRDEGRAALKLLDAASRGVVGAGDAMVAKAVGLGSQLDTFA